MSGDQALGRGAHRRGRRAGGRATAREGIDHPIREHAGAELAGLRRSLARRLSLSVIAGAVATLAAGAFALSFDALRELAMIAGLRAEIAWLWPFIVDGFIVIATAAAVLLRERGPGVVWYPWATLIVFAAVSVAGNAHHATNNADHESLSVSVAALVSAVPAVALLLASHLVVLLLSSTSNDQPALEVSAVTELDAGAPDQHGHGDRDRAVQRRTHESVDQLKAAERSRGSERPRSRARWARTADDLQSLQAWILDEQAAGRPVTGATVAAHLGVSPATGRRRLAAVRAGRPDVLGAGPRGRLEVVHDEVAS